MKNTIIIISGTILSGKDTLADFLVEKGYVKLAFGDALKRQAKAYLLQVHNTNIHIGDFYEKDVKDHSIVEIPFSSKPFKIRELLQQYGEFCKSLFGRDYWINKVITKIELEVNKNIVLSDARFSYEIDAIKNKFQESHNIITVRIERDIKSQNKETNLHISEVSLTRTYPFDYIFDNNKSITEVQQFSSFLDQLTAQNKLQEAL